MRIPNLVLTVLLGAVSLCACAPSQPRQFELPFTSGKLPLARSVRLILASDSHDNLALIDRFVDEANRWAPEWVIHAGDLQQFGSVNEWRAVDKAWSRLRPPLAVVPGNHDHRRASLAHFLKRYGKVPRSFDISGLHVVLLDDGTYQLGAQLAFLERDLAIHARQHTLVVLHVPLAIPPALRWLRLLEFLPSWRKDDDHRRDYLALPEPDGSRLAELLRRYRVDTLIAGHQHLFVWNPSEEGIPTLHLGTVGGYLPALGETHSYVTAIASDSGIALERHQLDRPPDGPFELFKSWKAYEAMSFDLKYGKTQ